MRKDYQNMQKSLLPSREKQDMIWKMIEKKLLRAKRNTDASAWEHCQAR